MVSQAHHSSHDIFDIMMVLKGQAKLIEEVRASSDELKIYLS